MFLGNYERTIDIKGRITLPKSFILPKDDKYLYVSKGFDQCLELRTAVEFEERKKELLNYSENFSQARLLARHFFSNTMKLKVDSVNRINIPPQILKIARIENATNIIIIGVGNKIEVWNYELWEKYNLETSEKYEECASELYTLSK